jgi:hypothetical protein
MGCRASPHRATYAIPNGVAWPPRSLCQPSLRPGCSATSRSISGRRIVLRDRQSPQTGRRAFLERRTAGNRRTRRRIPWSGCVFLCRSRIWGEHRSGRNRGRRRYGERRCAQQNARAGRCRARGRRTAGTPTPFDPLPEAVTYKQPMLWPAGTARHSPGGRAALTMQPLVAGGSS